MREFLLLEQGGPLEAFVHGSLSKVGPREEIRSREVMSLLAVGLGQGPQ